jgi:1,4-dihydroxy-2-naphthoyl-CoA hydrolase
MTDFLTRYEAARVATAGTFLDTLGVRLLEASEERSRVMLEARPAVATGTGLGVHGGALMALADHAAAVAAGYAIDPTMNDVNRFPATVQFNAHLVRNTRDGAVTAEARLVHRGRSVLTVETMVRDARDRVLLLATSTHVVITRTTDG